MLNERLGKYLLLERLASAGSDEIFLAKSSVADGLNKFFIIKKVLRTTTAKIEIPSLNHSNILAVFDSGIDRGFFFTVMDYFESFSLARILADFGAARCRLGIDQCLYVVRETAAALIYAHNYTAHGKIGTESILIGLDGAVKVSDFEFLKENKNESNSDLRTLGKLLTMLLGENRRANAELESLCFKALSDSDSFGSAGEFYREINRYLNTNYPEFSSPEFGEQLVGFYGVAVQEQRRRLLAFAKIDVPKAVQILVPDIYEAPEKSMISTVTQLTVSAYPEGFGEIPKKGANPGVTFENIDREKPFVPDSHPPPRPPPRFIPKIAPAIEEEKVSHSSDLILLLTVGTLLFLICYAYNITIKSYSKNMIESVQNSRASPELPAWHVEAMKENYSGDVLTRMRASKQLAYINIRINGATSDTRLFIDGKELIEKAPVKMFPIFAGRETVISALSAKSGIFDAKKINLAVGDVESVVLNLRKEKN